MKEIISKKMVEVEEKYFLAEDGKRFESEKDCKIYEKQKNSEQLEKEYKLLLLFGFNIPYMDYTSGNFGIDVVKLKNKDDYCTLMAYMMNASGWGVDYDLPEPESYPCIKSIAIEECYVQFTSSPGEILKQMKSEVDRIEDLFRKHDLTFLEKLTT